MFNRVQTLLVLSIGHAGCQNKNTSEVELLQVKKKSKSIHCTMSKRDDRVSAERLFHPRQEYVNYIPSDIPITIIFIQYSPCLLPLFSIGLLFCEFQVFGAEYTSSTYKYQLLR